MNHSTSSFGFARRFSVVARCVSVSASVGMAPLLLAAVPAQAVEVPAVGPAVAPSSSEGSGSAAPERAPSEGAAPAEGAESAVGDSRVEEAQSPLSTSGPADSSVDGREPTNAAEEPAEPRASKKKRRSVVDVQLVNDGGSGSRREPEPEVDPWTVPWTHHLARTELAVGGSLGWLNSPSVDLFSPRDMHGRLFVRGTRSFALGSRFGFAVAPEWSLLSMGDSNVRSLSTALLRNDWSLGLELRYHFHPRFVALGRLAPGMTHTKATLEGGTATLAHESVHFHASATLGLLGLLAGSANGTEGGTRLHWLVEVGYDWTPSRNLRFRPVEGSPERTQNFDWADFDLSMPQVSAGLALSF